MRQFALAGKVVVLDEVHSYDLYTGTLINRLVRRLRELKATPVILSATLTARQKAELLGEAPDANGCGQAPYPTITIKPDSAHSNVHCVLKDGETVPEKTVRIVSWPVPSFEDAASVVQEAVRLAEEGRNVVWVRNTVRHAQDAYRMLNGQKRQGSFDVGLLHSRFPAFQRGAYPQLSLDDLTRRHLHEERWLWLLGKPEPPRPDARPKASILVATQVVEQSVDIDADVLITDLAPTDMLLQRLGRLHRHDRGARGEPTAYVVVSRSLAENAESLAAAAIKDTLGGIGHVYAPYVLLRTWRQWRDRPAITLPTQIRDVLEKTYTEQENEPEDWTKLRKELEEEKRRLENLALSAVGVRGQPLGADEEGFGTRHIRQRQILLLLLRWVSSEIDRQHNPSALQLLDKKKLSVAQYGDFNLDAARRLHANAATIPAWWLPKAIREPLPPGLAQYFSEEVVLGVWDGQRAALTLGVTNRDTAPTICYRPDIGLWLERPPAQQAMRAEGDGEDEDGIF
jgi:CRISPR-associated endonuclease/helicase Cas3